MAPSSNRLTRFFASWLWGRRDREMDREMAFHLEGITSEYIAQGLSPEHAARAARLRFGNVRRLKEQGHDVMGMRFADDIARDIRHVTRGLRRSPAFTATVILTLAVGIGGNTAIFSLVDQVWLRPLPYPDSERLVRLYESFPGAIERNSASPANWFDWQRDSKTLEALAAWRTNPVTLTGVGDPIRLNGELVSWEFFPLLGVQPLLGRTVSETDDRPNAPQVVVLSHALWQHRFDGRSDVVGRIVQLNDRPAEIIGVMPASFQYPQPDDDLWINYRLDRTIPFRQRAGRFINVVGRVRRESSVPAARAEMAAIGQRLADTHPFNNGSSVAVVQLRDDLTGQIQTSTLVLYAAVGLLLFIACFNVANLLLARGSARQREIVIRASLGAGRGTIIRQLVVESLLLGLGGGALGIVFARSILSAVVAFVPADLIRADELALNWRVLAYAFALSLASGLFAGLVPAALVSRRSAAETLRATGPAMTHGSKIRQGLVILQIALTVLLLCGAGLLVRTLVSLSRTGNGLEKHGVLTMSLQLPAPRYDPARTRGFYEEALAALRALPGVENAAAGNSLAVIGGLQGGTIFHRSGTPPMPIVNGQPMLAGQPMASIRVVTPGYFNTLQIPVLRGREFTDTDALSPAPGFIVNEAFVKTYLAGMNPLDAVLSVWMSRENPYAPVIGVVGDVSEGSVREPAKPTIFYHHRQLTNNAMTVFLRSSRPSGLAGAAVAAIHRLDPNLAVTNVRTFDDAIAESLARDRLSALISTAFALSGLLLASLGVYGLLAFLVAERTREIATRIALGARPAQLTRLVVGNGLRMSAAGAAVGVAASLLLFRLLRSVLFGVAPYDPLTYLSVLALLLAVSALASYLPARRASRVQPLVALRQD